LKIKFLSGPRTGQTDHAPNSQEIQLLAKAGIIEIIPYKNFVEFMSAEHAQGSHPSNSNVPQVQAGAVEWSCSTLHDGRPVIWRKRGNETARFESEAQAAHHGAPESELKKFRDFVALLAGAGSAQATLERAKREQLLRQEEDKVGRAGVLWSRA